MRKEIDENFGLHATVIPRKAGMDVFANKYLTYVNSGLSCDTFNIIHITSGSGLERTALKAVIDYYRERAMDCCLWVSEQVLTKELLTDITAIGLQQSNEEAGMSLELKTSTIDHERSPSVQTVSSPSGLADFAEAVAMNWAPPDRNVIKYYDRTAQWYLAKDSPATLFTYSHNSKVVATLELFQTDHEIAGIYGFSTLEAFRGQGIGSQLFSHALAYAKSIGITHLILQATMEGIGIYRKMGFKTRTHYYEFA